MSNQFLLKIFSVVLMPFCHSEQFGFDVLRTECPDVSQVVVQVRTRNHILVCINSGGILNNPLIYII